MDASVPLAKQDFSLVLGGPLYQIFRRTHLSGPGLEQLWRRIWVITVVAWLPLLLLSARRAVVGSPDALPFLRDIEAQVRFLIALPVLIGAELVVHVRTRSVVAQFLDRGIVRPADVGRFDQLIGSAMRLRNSIPLEIGLVVLVATVGHWIWRSYCLRGPQLVRDSGGRPDGAQPRRDVVRRREPPHHPVHPPPVVSAAPDLVPLPPAGLPDGPAPGRHPSGPGRRPVVSREEHLAFGPFLFAQGALLSGLIATRVLYGGQNLTLFKLDAIGLIGFFVLVLLGPLTVFTPRLAEAKRSALARYGKLASEYVGAFEEKWIPPEGGRGAAARNGRYSVPRRPRGELPSSAR